MTVSMDGLRKIAIKSYNELIYQLKSGLNEDRNYIVYKDDIEECLDDLRNVLVTLACSYQEGEDGWKELENFELDSLTD